MNNQVREEKQQQLVSILLGNYRFHQPTSSIDSFQVDIILKVDIPSQPLKIPKADLTPLNFLRKKVTPLLVEAYKAALEAIERDTFQDNETMVKLNNIGGLERLKEQQHQQTRVSTHITDAVVKEVYEATPATSVFMLNLNLVMLTLQRECGFLVQKFILNDKVFLLIQCKEENLKKAGIRYKIKKEVVNAEIDIYLNEPLDSKNRPLLLNPEFTAPHHLNKFSSDQRTQHRLINEDNSMNRRELKRYHRKLGGVQNYSSEIINEVKLTDAEVLKYEKFLGEYQYLLKPLNQSPCDQCLDINELAYIRSLLNRKKLNPGDLRVFKQIKQKKRYFDQMEALVRKYDYDAFQHQSIYTPFFQLNKKKKHFDIVRSLFMFRPLVVGPNGELELFLKMEKTRLSYLILLEHFRLENFNKFGYEIFTLHNSFEKSGKAEHPTSVEGGLDGKNLRSSWSVCKPWKSDIKVIRDYLGETIAYFTFLKNRLILDLMVFSPISLLAFLIIILVLPLNLTKNGHLDTFVFYTTYAFVVLIWFSAYIIRQDQAEEFYFRSLREVSGRTTPNYGYKSPYVRNLISDSVNELREVKSIFNRVKEFLGLLFVIVLLLADIGVFYGIRSWTLVLQFRMSPSGLFFEWYSFVPIFIFFMGNHLMYILVLKRLFRYITSLENNPNFEKDESSTKAKCLIFRIGVELIGPLDLMVVEALGNYNCYDSSCWNAYSSFINIRFIVIFLILLIRFMIFLVEYAINRYKLRKEAERDLKQVEKGKRSESRIKGLFVKIIKEYSLKQRNVSIEEELIILVQLSLFSIIQPINIIISLLTILLDFYLERIQILHGSRRPINTATSTPNYKLLMTIPFYIFCAFNSWMLLVNFQDLQYVSPAFYLVLMTNPSRDKLTTLKIILALGLFCFMLLFEYIFRLLYLNHSEYSIELIKRKEFKLKEYLHKYKKVKAASSGCNMKPIVHIGRVKF